MKILMVAALSLIASSAIAAAPVTGKWITAEKDSIIEIGNCGSTVCGKVIRVLKMMPNGKMPIDTKNPNPALRGRPVQGMMILNGFTDDGKLWNGRIYDPKSGKSYKSKLNRSPDGTLNVQGCVAFFCQAFKWSEVK